MERIGIGIIGASVVNPGWATTVHIPAITRSDSFVLRAVSTSTSTSALAAADRFGVPAFTDVDSLLAVRGVDLVVVAVKVPHHHALISKALAAGKSVFSEWPLAVTLEQAEDLANRASSSGLATAIGLQGRYSPAIEKVKDFIRSGLLGEVLATSLVGSGMAWGPETDTAHAYMFEAGSGASVTSVPLMHAIDALIQVLGDLEQLTASSAIRRPTIRLLDQPSMLQNGSPDHIALSGRLRSGAVVSILYRGGTSRAGNLRWEINGTAGDLVLTSSNGNIQVADLEVRVGRKDSEDMSEILTAGETGALSGNVARLYEAIARDYRNGTRSVPDFAVALERHRLLANIEAHAEEARAGR